MTTAIERLTRILEMKPQPGAPPRTVEDDLALLRLIREQRAEIERLRAERLPAPPPECKSEAERNAYVFGFWSGVAAARKEGER